MSYFFNIKGVPAAGGNKGLAKMPWLGRDFLSAGGI